MTFVSAMQEMAEQQGSSMEGTGADDLENVDFSKLYEMQPMLEQMPSSYFDSARESAEAVDSSPSFSDGGRCDKGFYEELGIDTGSSSDGLYSAGGLYMLLLTLAGALATIGVGLLASRIAAGVARALRHDVFSKVENFGNREFDEYSTASLITRTTNDVGAGADVPDYWDPHDLLGADHGHWRRGYGCQQECVHEVIIAIGVVVLIGLIFLIYVLVDAKN